MDKHQFPDITVGAVVIKTVETGKRLKCQRRIAIIPFGIPFWLDNQRCLFIVLPTQPGLEELAVFKIDIPTEIRRNGWRADGNQ